MDCAEHAESCAAVPALIGFGSVFLQANGTDEIFLHNNLIDR
jgi:hypothetical protein